MPFLRFILCHISHIFVLFITGDFTIYNGPEPGAEVLSRRLRSAFRRKHVLDLLSSGTNDSAVACELMFMSQQ